MKQILETWDIHNNINLYLLDAIPEEHLSAALSSKGRTAGEQFAHMHNVRLMWLKAAAPELLEKLVKLEKNNFSKNDLVTALKKSAAAIKQLLEKGFKEEKIKGFKPHPSAFFGYLISHESHHRGQVMLALKQSGHPVDQKTQYGLWEWSSRQ